MISAAPVGGTDVTGLRATSRASLLHWSAVWVALALFSGSWLVTINRVEHRPTSWDRALGIQLGSFLLWALLAAPMVALARRVPWQPGRRMAALGVRALLALAAAMVHSGFQAALLAASLPADLRLEGWLAGFRHSVRFQLHFNLLIAALVLFADLALGWSRRAAERRLEAARLAESLVKARLAASRLRLRPRFLFDALATVRRRLATEPGDAERLVLSLASLLRAVLESWRHGDTIVREELELARTFVEIERARLARAGTPLDLELASEPAAVALELPSLILIPLLDDAIVAGGESAPSGLRLTLAASAGESEGVLELTIEAHHRGPSESLPAALFTEESLTVARERLAELFGPAPPSIHALELTTLENGARRLTLRLPPVAASRAERSDPVRFEEVLWSRS